jgi:aspartate aminotransferase
VIRLSNRISRVEPSPTLAITARAKALKADGVDVVSFGAGEPDFPTPAPIVQAAKDALDAGKTTYTPASGIPQLREAVANDYARRGRDVAANEVIITIGGKQALYNATQVVFEEGDKVVIPAPYWVSYPAQVKLAGAEPVTLESGSDLKISPDSLREALGQESVRGLILCSPSNPTGAAYSADELRALGAVIADFPDVVVYFDAIYDRLVYDQEIGPDLAALVPEIADRVITFNGFSKTYAMTGWRLGYAIGHADVIAAMGKLQSQSTSNATSFAQYGALAALDLPDDEIEKMRAIFRRRRDLIVGALNDIEGVSCTTPEGAFYVFPDFSTYSGDGKRFADDLELAGYLLDEAKVAVVPGVAFGAPGHMRLSYATSDDAIEEGISRIAAALT